MTKEFISRSYQEEVLSCPDSRIVVRAGRQVGKSTLIAERIHQAMARNPGIDVLLIAPYEAQLELTLSLVRDSLVLSGHKITLDVTIPYPRIRLGNYAELRCVFPDKLDLEELLCGHTADLLVLEETDYLSDEDINSALVIVSDNPGAKVLMSSTPSGSVGEFSKACRSNAWTEFYMPAPISPSWTPELEATLKEQLTETAYKYEILALLPDEH